MAKSPQQIAANWQNKMAQAGPNVTAGVQSVQTAPGQLAAAQSANYLAGVQGSVQKWQTNVGNVSLQSWQNSMTSKGIPRMASGAAAAAPKVAAFHAQLQPFQQNLKASLPPKQAKGNNMARMQAWHDGMLKFKKQ